MYIRIKSLVLKLENILYINKDYNSSEVLRVHDGVKDHYIRVGHKSYVEIYTDLLIKMLNFDHTSKNSVKNFEKLTESLDNLNNSKPSDWD